MKEKKQWHKPALIVLVRHKPEEAVLLACKRVDDPAALGCLDIGCGFAHAEISS